jgi:hypothetical protein
MVTWLSSCADLGPDLALDAAGSPHGTLLGFDADSCAGLSGAALDRLARRLRGFRAIKVAVGCRAPVPPQLAAASDLVLARDAGDRHTVVAADPVAELAAIEDAVAASPRAALTLAWLLRADGLAVPEALAAESAAYSMLQAGPDFAAWLRNRGPGRPPEGTERVQVRRVGDVLSVVLARPARRNAVDAAMRTALLDALSIARYDTGLRVEITALGPDFCAGGDLDEFGSAPDPATAHLVRVVAGVGGLLHEIRDRVTVRVHGACVGAGVELPCFAGRLVAARGTSFGLPEIGMGLVPGAGGTVSVPRRIGRWRTLWLALRGARIDADTALGWGLVDAVD